MEVLKETINKTYQNLYNNEKKQAEDIINKPETVELFKFMKQYIYAEHKYSGYTLRPLNIEEVPSVDSMGSLSSDGNSDDNEMAPTESDESLVSQDSQVSSSSDEPPSPLRTEIDDQTECSQVGSKEGDPCEGDSGKKCVSGIGDGQNLFCATEVEEKEVEKRPPLPSGMQDELETTVVQQEEMRGQKEEQRQRGTEFAGEVAAAAQKKTEEIAIGEQRLRGQEAAQEAAQQASEKIQAEGETRRAEEQRNAEEAAKTDEQRLAEQVTSEVAESDSDEDTTPTTATSVIPPPPSTGTPPPIPPVPSPPSSMSSVDEGMTDVMRQGIEEQRLASEEREREQQAALEAAKKAEEEKEAEERRAKEANKRAAELQLDADRQAEVQAEDAERRLGSAYLNGIKIRHGGAVKELNSVEAISHKLLNPELINFGVANKFLAAIEWKTAGKNIKKAGHWIDCKGKCYETLTKYLNMEFKLTAFMLRILSKSVIDITNENPLVFHITDAARLTGQWEHDKELIDIVEVEEGKKKRLIMGFGPSASGKTFWTENVIKMMDEADPNFPKVFMSVDGGIIREFSEIYQEVVRNTPKIILGFKNLTQGEKMAPTNGAKKAMKKYLFKQKEKNDGNSVISIYVPETLSKCKIPMVPCNSYYKDFMELTGDKDSWIGMYIWQERDKCIVSGKAREKKEGKKYTDKYYPTSKRYGLQEMKKGMGGRIDIHNSGTRDEKSTITEHPTGERKYLLNPTIVSRFNSNYRRADKVGNIIKERRKNLQTRVAPQAEFGQDELIPNPTGRNVTNIPPPSTPRGLPPRTGDQMGDAVRKKKAVNKATRKLKKKKRPVAPPRKQSLKADVNKTRKKKEKKGTKKKNKSGGRRGILTRKMSGNRSNRNITRRVRFRKLG
jgi:hypothetical protein